MTIIKKEELREGMTLIDEAIGPRGRLIAPAGAVVDADLLKTLMLWGPEMLNIRKPEAGELRPRGGRGPVRLDPATVKRVQPRVDEMFHLNTEHRGNAALKHIYVRSLMAVAREAEGEAPPEPLLPTEPPGDSLESLRKRVLEDLEFESVTPVRLARKAKSIVSMPAVCQELTRMIDADDHSAAEMARVISSDTGLAARLLRIVNSSFYSFPAKIETVSRAITIIGQNELRDLAIGAAAARVFGEALAGVVDVGPFWRHSVACGAFARALAVQRKEVNDERFFVIGLLHDVGRALIYAKMPEAGRVALADAASQRRPLHECERDLLGFDHASVGFALLTEWNLPVNQREAVACHHRPSRSQEYPLEASVVHVANVLAHALRHGLTGDMAVPPFEPEAWDRLGLSFDALNAAIEDAEGQIEELGRVFSDADGIGTEDVDRGARH